MREHGCTEGELFSFLTTQREMDVPPGFVLSSMCTPPHAVAIRAHTLFLDTNLGDPGLFPGTAKLEHLLVSRLGVVLSLPDAYGYATSGGTESNIQALRIARNQLGSDTPNVIVPASAHFSFTKACDLLGITMRTAPQDREFRMDPDGAAALVDRDTCALVSVAGTTEYGVVDPVPALARIARDHDVFFHVDAAFGGLVLPFLDNAPPFDFSVPGVSSMAIDPHKMGMSTIPAGCLLLRDPGGLRALAVDTPYLTVKQECTLTGTRPGGSVAAALAVLEYLGRDGMRAVVSGCMKNTRRLIAGMEVLGISRAVTPDVNVATFSPVAVPEPWRTSQTRGGHLRIICMPHVTGDMIEAFLRDMGEQHA